MNKTDLIAKIALEAGISKKAAAKALGVAIEEISKSLAKGDKVTLVGFGTFDVARVAARTARNPSTGEFIKVKAKTAPKFRAGTELKAAVAKAPTGGGGPGKKR